MHWLYWRGSHYAAGVKVVVCNMTVGSWVAGTGQITSSRKTAIIVAGCKVRRLQG